MSNYNNLKTTIDANIKQNGNQEITGPILNSVLNQMVTILGTGYQFAGVATLAPATNPGTPDAKVFYIANGKGTYTNFGSLEVTEDDVVVLYWDSAWHKVATGIASQAKLSELEGEINKDVDFPYGDFALMDGKGNVLANLHGGHIKTKNFDSERSVQSQDTLAELEVQDEQGNAILRVHGGHIKTKNFDSENQKNYRVFEGKNIAIIGDSISTNGNAGVDANVCEIVVATEDVGKSLSAYLTKYDVDNGLVLGGHTFTTDEIGNEVTFIPTSADIGKRIGVPTLNYNQNSVTTWWENMLSKLGGNAIPCCWSGGDLTSYRKDNINVKNAYAWHDSQIRKCGIRKVGTMERLAPDVIFIYRGTNDFSHGRSIVRLTDGYFDNPNFDYPSTDVIGDKIGFLEGYVLTIKKLRQAYPTAKIFCCTLNVFKRINYSHFPTNNGYNTLPQYNNAIRMVADFMGCGIVEFDKDGITFENCYPTFINDSATEPTHPNNDGHRVMGNKAVADVLAQWNEF